MKLAYIISAYKYPDQLIRLIHRLQSNKSIFIVHVDIKTPKKIFEQVVNGTKQWPNIHFLKRYPCNWGDFGHVRATLAGISELCERNVPFDYGILLTGQDYPIKTNQQIQEFFQHSDGKSFMEYFPLPHNEWEGGGVQRFAQWHIRINNHHYWFPKNQGSIIKRKFPSGYRPFGGSSYWCLSRECIEYIYRYIKDHRKFVNFFKYVDVPDELIFQTILLNSSLAGNIVNDDLRYISWNDPSSGTPAILVKDDFNQIASSPKLFARKFDLTVDAEILDMIDRHIL